MKSHMLFIQSLLLDCSSWCCTSTTRDFVTIAGRVKHEGFSFLAITLPAFCKDFERCLDRGCVDHTVFQSFKKRGALPLFLGGLLDLVFDRSSGLLLNKPCHTAIFFIRQITLAYKKTLRPCTKARTKGAIDAYIECEKEVQAWTEEFTRHSGSDKLDAFDRASSLLWGSVLSRIDRSVYHTWIIPRHGPGSTSERISSNAKFALKTWHSRLEDYFPSDLFVIPNYGFSEELANVDFLEPDAEIYPRVVTVPKTLKSPRIIAIEPVCMQYTQQSILEVLVEDLERDELLGGSLGFTDQVPNQCLAREGSSGGRLATIDLSDASDRVSNWIVKRMTARFPHVYGALQACRSTHANVPGYGLTPLSKFASMGSAVCFPIEAMVFLNIITSVWLQRLSEPVTRKGLKAFLRTVRVYGDDIIVPVDLVEDVVRELSYFNMKVNSAKSFWTGKFRESCGKDFYDGTDVTVSYVRRDFPTHRRDAEEMISAISLRNQLYQAGLWRTCAFLDNMVRGFAPFPIVEPTSPILGRTSFLPYRGERDDVHLHRPLVRGLVVVSTPPPSVLDGYGALMKFFLKRGNQPAVDAKHLERSGRPLFVD
ncbi:RNA-directed RNA polymerase, partial [ssRNA phage Esthiorhiza.3_9]